MTGHEHGSLYTDDVLRAVGSAARLIAIVLLTWTAIDLACPQYCLDEQTTVSTSSAAASTSGASQGDVNDCFCCARCIDTGVRIPEMRVTAAWIDFAEPVRSLTSRSSSLDHPPQNS